MTGEERTKHAWLKGNLISVLLFLVLMEFKLSLSLSACSSLLCMLEVNTFPLCEALDFPWDEMIDVCF